MEKLLRGERLVMAEGRRRVPIQLNDGSGSHPVIAGRGPERPDLGVNQPSPAQSWTSE
jgi:hypothetical protein